ncbi:MAG TPA: SCO1664 family protein [Anaerolineales bacterium]|nr:SCO1664 family protein [Anaerolineales bacterium]
MLAEGRIVVEGQFVWGSNYTFLARVHHAQGDLLAVYKPQRGEQPLWDFADGTLASREVAAWCTSDNLGWHLVPPTVLRPDGPLGAGSLQRYLDLDPERHYFTFEEDEKQRLRPAALFDVLVNNADRKGGHILLDEAGHVWLIDHGVCFHHEPKLRTVVWDFAGEPIPDDLRQDVAGFHRRLTTEAALQRTFAALLAPAEVEALQERAAAIVGQGTFPFPGEGRPYPWPLV